MRAFILVLCILGCPGLAVPARGADTPPVLPEIAASHRLTLVIREGDGTPVAARLSVFDPATGEPYWPEDPAVPIYEAYTGHDYFYAEDRVTVVVDEGWVRLVASRGPEYPVVDQTFYVSRSLVRSVGFIRLFDASAYGFYGGDTHVHIAHGGEGDVYEITGEELALAARAEDLNVTCALTNGLYFNGGLDPAGDARHLIHFGVEYRSALYGHMGVLGLSSLISSFGCCLPGYPASPLNMDVQAEAHGLGATVIYAHPVSVDPAEMADTRLDWPYSGLARELPVDLLIGEVDAYDLFSYSNSGMNASRELWFDLLNLGRRLPVSAGTDAGLNRYFDPPIGGYRVYVRSPGGLDFASWLENLRAGHSFATNGPLLMECTLDGVAPGDTLSLPAEGATPLQGRILLMSRSPMLSLELYSSGRKVSSITLPEYDGVLDFSFTMPRPSNTGWVVARVIGPAGSPADIGGVLEAVTSPVRIQVGEEAMEPQPGAVARFLDWIALLKDLVRDRGGWETTQQLVRIWNTIESARVLLAGSESAGSHAPEHEHFEQLDRAAVTLDIEDGGRRFRASGRGTGVLEVFDVQGRRVYASEPRPLPAEFLWRDEVEGRGLASGLYFGRIRTDRAVSRTYRLRLLR